MATLSLPSIVRTQNYVGGAWLNEGEGSLDVLDKYSDERLARLPLGTAAQMEAAIVAAQAGLRELRTWSAGRRSAALELWADLLADRRHEFVDLLVKEAGKPVTYARGEVERALVTLRTAAAEALRFTGETVAMDFGPGEGKPPSRAASPGGS